MDKKEVRLVLAKGAMEKIRIYMGHRGDIEKCARNVFSGIPLVFLLHCSHADMNKNFAVDRRDNDISLSDTHAVDPKIIALSADADTVRPLPEDTLSYFLKLKKLANNDRSGRWPPVTAFPGQGALLPYNRIVAYYGNFFSTKMGILGSHPPEIMLQKLRAEVIQWEKADTATPVKPALHYIAVTAQRLPGADGKYRLRMPFREIDKAVLLAKEVKGLVFLDVQVGFSTLQQEIPLLEKYLLMPEVHLGIDPEYSMKGGQLPGTAVGSFDAADINYAATYLSGLVKKK